MDIWTVMFLLTPTDSPRSLLGNTRVRVDMGVHYLWRGVQIKRDIALYTPDATTQGP